MVGCDGLETCLIKATKAEGDFKVCDETAAVSSEFTIPSNIFTARKDVIIGYEHVICMMCKIHDTLTINTVFTVK